MMARWKFRRAECGTVWPAARPSFTPTAGHSIFWTLVFAAIGIPIAFFVLQTIWRKEIDLAGFLKGPSESIPVKPARPEFDFWLLPRAAPPPFPAQT